GANGPADRIHSYAPAPEELFGFLLAGRVRGEGRRAHVQPGQVFLKLSGRRCRPAPHALSFPSPQAIVIAPLCDATLDPKLQGSFHVDTKPYASAGRARHGAA